jgi:AcrR family transcriptional regulator/NAD(P)-dependent dehydrogenase (short-subunit alcohol dehydrogenase family)
MKQIPTTIKNKDLVERRRAQIVISAIKLFSQKGFHKTTLRELSDEAGLSYGNLYDYIGSKEDIFSLIHDYAANLTMRAVRDSIKNVTDPIEKLRRIVRAEFKLMDQMADAILLIYQETHILSKPFLYKLLKKERQHLELIEQAIEESRKTGQLRDCNVRLAANFIKSMIDTWVIKRWDLRGYVNRLEAERFILELVLNGLLSDRPAMTDSKNGPEQRQYEISIGLRGQTAFIANSGTPIGTALCNSLLSCGVKLSLYSGPPNPTRENPVTCDSESENVRFFSSSEHGSLNAALFKKIEERHDQIDIYIQDLGIGTLDIESYKNSDPGDLLDANLKAAEEVASLFLSDPNKKSPHRVLFIAPWCWDRYVNSIHYEIVKAGIIALTKNLSYQLAGRGITVNCIVPGFLKTTRPSTLEKQYGDNVQEKIPSGVMGEINDLVEAMTYLSGDTAKYITGQIINVSGGLN